MRAKMYAAVVTMLSVVTSGGAAEAHDQFYAGKTISIYVGSSPGAGYDLYARLLARFLSNHVPGSPNVVVKNMPGAGGITLANWLFNAAPRDGTTMATFGRGVAFDSLINPPGTFDGRKLAWVGSMSDEVSVCAATAASGFTKFDDLLSKQLVVGASGAGGDTAIFPQVLNGVLGTKMKIVYGYPGGNDINLAMERGELSGRCGWSWSSLIATHRKKIESGEIRPLVQLGLAKHPDLPNVPLVLDFADNPRQRASLELIFARQSMAWPFAMPPGTPEERVKEMRAAFNAATSDPSLQAEAKAMELEVRPVKGEMIEQILMRAHETPKDIVTQTTTLLK